MNNTAQITQRNLPARKVACACEYSFARNCSGGGVVSSEILDWFSVINVRIVFFFVLRGPDSFHRFQESS
jgi:hypothetical protein